jgi:hypothetical protein
MSENEKLEEDKVKTRQQTKWAMMKEGRSWVHIGEKNEFLPLVTSVVNHTTELFGTETLAILSSLWVLFQSQEKKKDVRFLLDIGTGNGSLLSLLHNHPSFQIEWNMMLGITAYDHRQKDGDSVSDESYLVDNIEEYSVVEDECNTELEHSIVSQLKEKSKSKHNNLGKFFVVWFDLVLFFLLTSQLFKGHLTLSII